MIWNLVCAVISNPSSAFSPVDIGSSLERCADILSLPSWGGRKHTAYIYFFPLNFPLSIQLPETSILSEIPREISFDSERSMWMGEEKWRLLAFFRIIILEGGFISWIFSAGTNNGGWVIVRVCEVWGSYMSGSLVTWPHQGGGQYGNWCVR